MELIFGKQTDFPVLDLHSHSDPLPIVIWVGKLSLSASPKIEHLE